MSKQDHYETLGVSRTASTEEIRRAYRRLAAKYHPDRPGGGDAEKFKQLSEALEILEDPQKRQNYDAFGDAQMGGTGGFSGFGEEDLGTIFQAFFGGEAAAQRESIRIPVTLTLEEVLSGISKEIMVPGRERCTCCNGSGQKPGTPIKTCSACGGSGKSRWGGFIITPCSHCNGKGKVIASPCGQCQGQGSCLIKTKLRIEIPPGVEENTILRLSGTAHREKGQQNIEIYIQVKKHEFFSRQGKELFCTIPISFATAALGGEIEIPTLQGKIRHKLPSETQTHTVLTLKSEGLPGFRSKIRGPLHCRVVVETPTALTQDQKALIAQLEQSLTKKPPKAQRPVWSKFLETIKRVLPHYHPSS